ncbi:MAG: TRAM domain-containing protein [Acidobacteria bacterium]|nr:TRAM domain-containing protein [Acidobacteriota bacterium]
MFAWMVRVIFVVALSVMGYFFHPFGLAPGYGALLCALLGLGIAAGEIQLRSVTLKTIAGALIGLALGILGASLLSLIIARLNVSEGTENFLQTALLLLLAYLGLLVGASKGEFLDLTFLGGVFAEKTQKRIYKILDTSVIIDGRVADICETGFLEGTLVVPQFVLRELQQIADSPDSIKRNRGRRGLDILQRVQKKLGSQVQIVERDTHESKEVDLKLIDLAREMGAKIVTNDFNLNKVAQLRGVEVLNINELANALKPVVLPGETMKVFILKEGKEPNQGVAYLDDGTMVVVDNARRLIGKTVDIQVTSVLQTTAGKMIFGRFTEDADDEGKRGYHQDERKSIA